MDVGGASGRGVHSCLKAENTMRFYHLVVLREYLACTGPDYLGEARSYYGNRRGTRAVRGFKLRFTGLYNVGFPSYTVGYRSTLLLRVLFIGLFYRGTAPATADSGFQGPVQPCSFSLVLLNLNKDPG